MKVLVTSALPYANGPMHLGHVRSTYIPADIYVRFLRSRNVDVKYVCGTDEHGTPIVIRAEEEGKTPLEIANRYHDIIEKELRDLGISFDNFSQTSRDLHHDLTQHFYKRIQKNGYIYEKKVMQLFCQKCGRFLPDRYVVGICSYCGAEARGDHCEACGRHLNARELRNPRCVVCGSVPVQKETTHYFFKLSAFSKQLSTYLKTAEISQNAKNYASRWLSELEDWDITRDMQWGVGIPNTDKVFYVWFDAPIGYISFTKEITDDWRDYWSGRVVHFIGKDIIYHHVLFWPAMLIAEGEFPPPAVVQAGGFLTLEGEKMSTSRNHVVWIRDYLNHFPPDYLRFYLVSAASIDQDIDFSWRSFADKINTELIGNYGNFINRVLTFCKNHFDGTLPAPTTFDSRDLALINKIGDAHSRVTKLMEKFDFLGAIRELMRLSKFGNEYFQSKEPWKGGGENVVYLSVNLARSLAVLLEPFIPFSSKEILKQIKTTGGWETAGELFLKPGHKIGNIHPVFRKIEESEVEAEIKKLKEASSSHRTPSRTGASTPTAKTPSKILQKKKMIGLDDFEKLDLRVAEILSVEPHPNADKLYVMEIDLGGEKRQIVAGLRKYYKPEELRGKRIVVIANLKPAKLRGVESNGMLLAAEKDGKLALLTIDKPIENGAVVG